MIYPHPVGRVAVCNGWITIEHRSESLGFYSQIQAMCHWSLDLILKAKLKYRVWKQTKKYYSSDATILKVVAFKIHELLLIPAHNMYIKFEIEIPKQNRVTFRKPCRLIRKPKDPICLPGGYFESGIAKIDCPLPIHTGNEVWIW